MKARNFLSLLMLTTVGCGSTEPPVISKYADWVFHETECDIYYASEWTSLPEIEVDPPFDFFAPIVAHKRITGEQAREVIEALNSTQESVVIAEDTGSEDTEIFVVRFEGKEHTAHFAFAKHESYADVYVDEVYRERYYFDLGRKQTAELDALFSGHFKEAISFTE